MEGNAQANKSQWAAEWRDYINGRWKCSVPGCGREPAWRITDSQTGALVGYSCKCDYPRTTAHLEKIQGALSSRKAAIDDVELWG